MSHKAGESRQIEKINLETRAREEGGREERREGGRKGGREGGRKKAENS